MFHGTGFENFIMNIQWRNKKRQKITEEVEDISEWQKTEMVKCQLTSSGWELSWIVGEWKAHTLPHTLLQARVESLSEVDLQEQNTVVFWFVG